MPNDRSLHESEWLNHISRLQLLVCHVIVWGITAPGLSCHCVGYYSSWSVMSLCGVLQQTKLHSMVMEVYTNGVEQRPVCHVWGISDPKSDDRPECPMCVCVCVCVTPGAQGILNRALIQSLE